MWMLKMKNQMHVGTAKKQKDNKHRGMNKRILSIEKQVADLEKDNAKLKEFAREIILDECWDLGGSHSRDGAAVQDLADNLGLIELTPANDDDVDQHEYIGVGDPIYKFSEILNERVVVE